MSLRIKQESDCVDFIDRLRSNLKQPLPGLSSQLKMSSRLRESELASFKHKKDPIKSSVLILLYPKQNQLFTCLILRQSYNGVHSGQVSFPGGRFEDSDPSLIGTALREAQEEVNIDPRKVTVLGTLTELYIPPSNFLVLPVVGYAEKVPEYEPDAVEVAEIIETDLDFLFDDSYRKRKTIHARGNAIDAPYFDVKGHVVWGATAMILSELIDVIRSID